MRFAEQASIIPKTKAHFALLLKSNGTFLQNMKLPETNCREVLPEMLLYSTAKSNGTTERYCFYE